MKFSFLDKRMENPSGKQKLKWKSRYYFFFHIEFIYYLIGHFIFLVLHRVVQCCIKFKQL